MSQRSEKYRFREEPRLSANQLAEYINASPTRRRSIIRQAKFPPTSVVARYRLAREAVTSYLLSKNRSPIILYEAIEKIDERLQDSGDMSSWTKSDLENSKEIVNSFANHLNNLSISGIHFIKAPSGISSISVSGVEISASLDAACEKTGRNGSKERGGIICLFSRGETSIKARQNQCKTSAVIAWKLVSDFSSNITPSPKLCFSLDVNQGLLVKAPQSYKSMDQNIRLSCEEVALAWSHVAPPSDYDGPDFTEA